MDRWPSHYFASRDRFVEAAEQAGAVVSSCPTATAGPGGEPLSSEIARLGPVDAAHRIVITSGVHGAEGLLGAMAQCMAMRRLAHDGLPPATSLALIHAVNPWGFAHRRRVDERNVDVNRNFLETASAAVDDDTSYAALDALINPRTAPSAIGELAFWSRAARLIARERGLAPLASTIAAGQHGFPKGLFHAGVTVGESARTLQTRLCELTRGASRVTHLDVHSGLGPPATVTLIGRTNIGPPDTRAERLQTHYGQRVVLDDAAGNAYDAAGTLARWYGRTLVEQPFLYLCVEVGTVNPLKILSALRRENQAHHWTPVDSRPYRDTKQALVDVFVPRSRRWRTDSLAQALHALDRTLALPVVPNPHGV